MPVVGDATIVVDSDTGPFDKNLRGGVEKSATGAGSIIKGILGAQVVQAGLQAGVSFLKGSVDAARESNAVAAQTAAAIKSTGGAAKVTAGEIDNLANSIARKTGIDDEEIAKAENLLLTFTNVRNEAGKGNDIFNQSTAILADMGKALGTDTSSAAIQLGKALNDPIAGISALSRVGVTFNDEQKKTIENLVKTGDVAGAQKIILAELGKEFGGSAEAQATASDKLKVSLGNIQEQIGNKLIPVIDKVATFLANNLPGALDAAGKGFGFVRDVVVNVSDALRPFIEENLPKVIAAVSGVVEFVKTNLPAFQEAFEHVVNAVTAIFETALPIILPIVEGVIGEVVTQIKTIVAIIKEVVMFVTNIINGDFGAAFGNLKNIVTTAIGGALEILRGLGPKALEALGAVAALAGRAALGIGKAIIEGIGKGLAAVAGFAGDIASGVLRAIKNVINTQVIDRINAAIPDSLGAGPFKINLPKNPIPRLASGALIQAVPGGILANIGEGRHDEAVLPLPAGVIEGLQAIARGALTQTSSAPLVGQMILQGATFEGANANASAIIRELRGEAWRQGK